VDPISKLVRTLAIGRRKVQDRPSSATTASNTADAPAARSTGDASNADLARKIKAVDLETPGGRDACVRIVVENMLAREFGTAVVASAAMQQTIRDVQRVMDSHPESRRAFDTLIGSLRNQDA
jgi:hypothetical protein